MPGQGVAESQAADRTSTTGSRHGVEVRELVVAVAGLMVAGQIAFRAWTVYRAWFFLDDYTLLHDALGVRPGAGYLTEPYNGHLMPVGRLVAWLVQASGPLDWPVAATSSLLLQGAASLAMWWMLTVLFGSRWSILPLLALYLTTAVTLPAFLWWSAALTWLGVQAATCAAVAAWVRHLRGDGRRWLVATLTAVLAGLLCDGRTLLAVPILVYLALAYAMTGGLRRRIVRLLRQQWRGLLGLAAIVGGYVGYYATVVPARLDGGGSSRGHVAQTMLATAFPAGAAGGPWRWADLSPPTAYADPPDWAVHLAWIVLAGVAAYAGLTRTRAGRAGLLLALHLLALLGLVLLGRDVALGPQIGLDYRYLTESATVLTLAVGLALLPVRGLPGSSAPRTPAVLGTTVPTSVSVVLVAAIVAGSLVSSVQYAGFWHHDNASDAYVHRLQQDLRAHGDVDLADQTVPDAVVSHLAAPANTSRRLVDLLTHGTSIHVRYPDSSAHLAVVGDDGTLRVALISPGVVSAPGPRTGCGWLVAGGPVTIPLTTPAFSWTWWVRIGYLASATQPVVVTAGTSAVTGEVDQGTGSLYVRVQGSFDSVTVRPTDATGTMCVDTVEVGQPVPGSYL